MGPRQALEEQRALEGMIARMEISMTRGANWLISQFAPHGPIMAARDLSYCHKVVWGLFEDGRWSEVDRLLQWIQAQARQGPGRYFFPEEPPFNKDMQLLYRFLTFARVAETLRHPAFSTDEIRQEVLAYQHRSGGVFANREQAEYRKSLNPLLAAFFGEWALAAGLLDPARKAGDFLVRVTELNERFMKESPGRFYFNFDPVREELQTKPADGENINSFVDTAGAKQHFYFIGAAMALLADLYAIVPRDSYLSAAEKLAAFEDRLNPQALKWPSYCKIGWGAAELYAVTGHPEHRRMAANVAEVTFMRAQTASGGWEHMFYPLRDAGAWTRVEYDGQGRVAHRRELEDDGSWAWLSGHEITGEFLGEMGCTLKVFKAALVPGACFLIRGAPEEDEA